MRTRGLIWVLCAGLGGLSLSARASSCAHLLAFHFSDEELTEVAGLPEMHTFAGLLDQRRRVQTAMAQTADTLFPGQLSLAASRGGMKRWELVAHRRGLLVSRRLWRLRNLTKAAAALQAKYDRLALGGVELESRLELVLHAALEEYARLTGDHYVAEVEAAIEQHQILLGTLHELAAPLREARGDVEDLLNAARVHQVGDAERVRLRALPAALDALGPRLGVAIAAGTALDLPATRDAGPWNILMTYFGRGADEWRARLGGVDPRREGLQFLNLRLGDAERLLEAGRGQVVRQMAELQGRLTETLIRLEDLYIQGREAGT